MIAERAFLPAGSRLPGTTSWLIAATTLTLLLATAAALALDGAGTRLRTATQGLFHVQIVAADPERRDADLWRALTLLRGNGDVAAARPLDGAAMKTLRTWLGDMAASDLPMPALIEGRLAPGADRKTPARLLARIRTARIDMGDDLMAFDRLIEGLHRLASAIATVAAAATALVTVLATRAALAGHGRTVATLHSLGATDGQLARLIARRILAEAGAGAAIGCAAGLIALAWIGGRLAALESGLADGAVIGWGGLSLLLIVLPIAVAALAVSVAHVTMLAMLRRSP